MKKQHADLFDRPIAFHRCLAELSGSVAAGLMLSQALYWSKRTSDADGWFWKTAEDWQEETTLTRREQETARKSLREIDGGNVWFEERRGVPAKLYFRLDTDRLMEILIGGKVQSSFHKSAILDSPKQPNKSSQIRQSFLLTKTTTENTAESGGLRPLTQPEALTVALEFFPRLPVYHHELITQAQISQMSIWRECCQMWRDNRYSERNISGLIDSYYRRESQDSRRNNGQNQNHRISNGERAALDTERIVAGLLSGDPETLRRFGCADSENEGIAVAPRLLGR